MILRSKIPLRISLNGGGTDVDPYSEKFGGIVVSSAINKYVYASLEERKDQKIKIISLDYKQIVRFNIKKKIAISGNLKLIKAIIKHIGPFRKGFNLSIHCDAPTGSGLGTSGSLGSMLVMLLSKYKNKKLSKNKAAEIALKIEREKARISGGKQDQYAGLFGGFNLLKFKSGYKCKPKKINLQKSFIDELNYNCLLIYTKKNHYSNDLLDEQIKRYKKNSNKTINSLHKMKKINDTLLRHLKNTNIYEIGKFLDYTWELKKKVNPLVTTKDIDKLYKNLKKVGVTGGKILGAGGGGYMLILLPFYLKNKAIKIVKKHNMEVSDFDFESEGIKIWSVNKKLINNKSKKYFL